MPTTLKSLKFVSKMSIVMERAMIKEKLINYIEHADDKRLEEMYSLLGLEKDEEDERKMLVQEERTKYLNGEGKSFSPEEVKAMALNKSQRHAL